MSDTIEDMEKTAVVGVVLFVTSQASVNALFAYPWKSS